MKSKSEPGTLVLATRPALDSSDVTGFFKPVGPVGFRLFRAGGLEFRVMRRAGFEHVGMWLVVQGFGLREVVLISVPPG